MLDHYVLSQWGLLFILFTMLLQAIIAMVAHRKQAHCIPGIMRESLGHESFVFRSHRTFQNSLENTPMMLGTAFVAMFSDFSSSYLAIAVWLFAIARFVHMVLYYVIATEKNPSPRSHFFGIALITNLVLVVMVGIHLGSQL